MFKFDANLDYVIRDDKLKYDNNWTNISCRVVCSKTVPAVYIPDLKTAVLILNGGLRQLW